MERIGLCYIFVTFIYGMPLSDPIISWFRINDATPQIDWYAFVIIVRKGEVILNLGTRPNIEAINIHTSILYMCFSENMNV